MALGYDREQNIVNINDTAELYAYLFDREDQPVADDLVKVSFTVQKPDGTRVTGTGEIREDGAGFYRFADTDQEGEYLVIARFTFVTGEVRSTRSDFEVSDPFRPSEYTLEERVGKKVWDKIEDLFDSTDGGPWMRDMTLNVFNPSKMVDFIEEAIFDINVYNPPTDFFIEQFAQPLIINGEERNNPNLTVLVQGTLVAVVRHLMRTYAEQPLPQGGQVTYEDRRDYLQRWGTIYQIENEHFDHLVKLWKRQFLGIHNSKSLVSNKAGRLLPAPLRSRNIGRGFY